MTTINPALLLAAAQLTYQDGTWFICSPAGEPAFVTSDIEPYQYHCFDPMKHDEYGRSHAFMLERALKKLGWMFWSYPDGFSCASNERMMIYDIKDPSDTLLLLKCFSAQTGIELYEQESAS